MGQDGESMSVPKFGGIISKPKSYFGAHTRMFGQLNFFEKSLLGFKQINLYNTYKLVESLVSLGAQPLFNFFLAALYISNLGI